mgnify:CR=1 FL=1
MGLGSSFQGLDYANIDSLLSDEEKMIRVMHNLVRNAAEAVDSALKIGRAISLEDADVALLLTELGEPRLRKALTTLLDRRMVARDALNRFVRGRDMSVDAACARLRHALRGVGW